MAMLYPHYDEDEMVDLMKTHYVDYFPHEQKKSTLWPTNGREFNLTETTTQAVFLMLFLQPCISAEKELMKVNAP